MQTLRGKEILANLVAALRRFESPGRVICISTWKLNSKHFPVSNHTEASWQMGEKKDTGIWKCCFDFF